MTTARRPVHLAVLGGVSAGIYALALAGVTGAQSASDATLDAARAPVRIAADGLTDAHDDLDRTLAAAGRSYETAADAYARVSTTLVDLESAIDRLAGRVSDVTGTADALPTRVRLPAVTVRAAAPKAPKPVVHATTRASG